MKILVVITGGLKNDGISLGTIEYFNSMEKDDMVIDFLAVNNLENSVVEKIKNAKCNLIKTKERNKNHLQYMYALYKIIRRNNYDIIHVHGSSALLVIEMFIAKIAGVKIRIAHSRNTKCNNVRIDKLLRSLFYKCTTDYFACGKEAGEWLFENNKFTIIPNGKNIKKFKFSSQKRKEVRKYFKIDNKLVIGHVGRINHQKNHEFLIDIFYEVKKINSNVVLVLVGDGELKNSIREKIEKLGLIDDVIMTGELNNTNEIMQGMDIMVMPSLYEGLPNVIIEAQIAGLPCIISDTITKECKITENVDFESLNSPVEIWAKKILDTDIIDREHSRDKIISQVRKAGYDIDENAKRLKNIYFDLYNN